MSLDSIHPGWRTRCYQVVACLLIAATLPFAFHALINLSMRSGNVTLWFPRSSEERKEYDRFSSLFGNHDTLIVSWPGCRAEDEALRTLPDSLLKSDEDGLILRVSDYSTIAGPSPSQATKEALKGFVVGIDGEAGCLIVESSEAGATKREQVFDFVSQEVSRATGIPEEKLIFGGPCYLAMSADAESGRTIRLVFPLVAAISLVVALVLLRSFTLGLLAFAISGLAAIWAIAAIHYSGKELGNMLSVVPSLAQLIAMSNAIHLINYYNDFVMSGEERNSGWKHALRVGWPPSSTASLTTIFGFLSLLVSDMQAVRDFASIGAMGVAGALIAVLLATPVGLSILLPKPREPLKAQKAAEGFLNRITHDYTKPITFSLLSVLIFCLVGLPRLGSNFNTETFFAEHSKFRKDLAWYTEHFGQLQDDEVLLSFKNEVPLANQLQFVDYLTSKLNDTLPGASILSPAAWMPEIPPGIPPPPPGPELEKRFLDANRLAIADAEHVWRLTIRHALLTEASLSALPDDIESFREEFDGDKPEIIVTGGYRLFTESQGLLLSQLLRSFFAVVVFVTPVVMIFLRSVRIGLVAILGNLFPLIVFFGLLGWLGIKIDIAMMMVAAVAFGIAVDDTVHFLTWLARGRRMHGFHGSVDFAYRHSAGAILQTTATLSLGLLAFLISDFKPSLEFAICSAIVLVFAVIGDLILLPAVIRAFPQSEKQMRDSIAEN